MSKSKPTPRIHVVSDVQRRTRRTWSDDQKLSIIRESEQDGVVLAQLARRHGISPSQLYDWRYRYNAGLLGGTAKFFEVKTVTDGVDTSSEAPVAVPELVVDVSGQFRITIPSGFDMASAAQLLRGLA